MSCDITRVFNSTVRALSASSLTPKTSAAPSVEASLNTDSFATRAHRLHTELVTVRRHLGEAGELSQTLATNDATRQRMYNEVANEVNRALEQCGELLKQLRRRCSLDETGKAELSQVEKHRKAVCRSLEDFLKTLQRARDEQVATYCRRVELVGRLGDTTPSNLDFGVRNRSGGDTNWLFGSSSLRDTEALPSDSLTETEFKQLETENVEVYLRFLSERNEIQHLGSQISEIGRLQAMVTESLVEQAETAQRIGENVVGSTELVREANEHLRQSMEKTRSVRFWIIFIILTLTFSLHFLDWYS